MRNILFWLSFSVFLFLSCWFMLGLVGEDPLALVQTHFGVSHDVAGWIFLGVLVVAGASASATAP